MAIFDDPKKELEKLEKELLAEEDWFEKELESAKKMLGDEPVKKTKKAQRPMDETQVYRTSGKPAKTTKSAAQKPAVRNTEKVEKDYSEEVYAPKKEKGVKGLIILACLETLGIVAVVAYWLIHLL